MLLYFFFLLFFEELSARRKPTFAPVVAGENPNRKETLHTLAAAEKAPPHAKRLPEKLSLLSCIHSKTFPDISYIPKSLGLSLFTTLVLTELSLYHANSANRQSSSVPLNFLYFHRHDAANTHASKVGRLNLKPLYFVSIFTLVMKSIQSYQETISTGCLEVSLSNLSMLNQFR